MARKTNIDSEALKHLRILNGRGKVALFVGAGVSVGCGLPDWGDLLARLMRRAFADQVENAEAALIGYSPISKTRILRTRLRRDFNYEVARVLYEYPHWISPAVEQIVKSGIRRICCFNFDDILEEAFQIEGHNFHSIEKGDRFNNNFRGTCIYHPHGILRSSDSVLEAASRQIVFDEEDYNRLYSEPYAWANIIQLSLLTNYTCLFVGVSLQDPNIRRLLDVFNSLNHTQRHYAILKSPRYAVDPSQVKVANQIKKTLDTDLRNLNVKPVWVSKFEDISIVFKHIRNRKADEQP